jgi:hypothetical protein
LGARVKTEVSLEEKVMGVEMLTPVVDCTEAVKFRVLPSTREESTPGVRITLPGKMGVPCFAAPPHPLKLHRERTATANRRTFESDLPMHPSLNPVPALRGEIGRTRRRMNWKTCSVEAGGGIGKRCECSVSMLLKSARDPWLRWKNGFAQDDATI